MTNEAIQSSSIEGLNLICPCDPAAHTPNAYKPSNKDLKNIKKAAND